MRYYDHIIHTQNILTLHYPYTYIHHYIQEYRSLMANMSHDLKTPLAGATNGLEYLEGLLRCAPEVGDKEAGKALRVDLLAG